MKVERKLTLKDVFALVRDPRQTKKVKHDLVDVLVAAAVAVLCGADTFVEVEAWAKAKLEGLRDARPHPLCRP